MKNLTILYSRFKRELANCPEIKVTESKNLFDPPNESRKKRALADLEDFGYDLEPWLGQVISLSQGNSLHYIVLRAGSKGFGSFNFNNPEEYLTEAEPWHAKLAKNEADKEVLKQARIIDQPDLANTFVALVCPKGLGSKLPKQLVYFRNGHLVHLELGLDSYFEALEAFMGYGNWQLLFAVPGTNLGLFKDELMSLEAGLADFKSIFPDRDFGLWESKLEMVKAK